MKIIKFILFRLLDLIIAPIITLFFGALLYPIIIIFLGLLIPDFEDKYQSVIIARLWIIATVIYAIYRWTKPFEKNIKKL